QRLARQRSNDTLAGVSAFGTSRPIHGPHSGNPADAANRAQRRMPRSRLPVSELVHGCSCRATAFAIVMKRGEPSLRAIAAWADSTAAKALRIRRGTTAAFRFPWRVA